MIGYQPTQTLTMQECVSVDKSSLDSHPQICKPDLISWQQLGT